MHGKSLSLTSRLVIILALFASGFAALPFAGYSDQPFTWQRYLALYEIFSDGFNRGNACAWSVRVPDTCSAASVVACALPHHLCASGEQLGAFAHCDPCIERVCALDPFCCEETWDPLCIEESSTECALDCSSVVP